MTERPDNARGAGKGARGAGGCAGVRGRGGRSSRAPRWRVATGNVARRREWRAATGDDIAPYRNGTLAWGAGGAGEVARRGAVVMAVGRDVPIAPHG